MDDFDNVGFLNFYSLVGSTSTYTREIEKGKCRICSKGEPDVTFKKEAHLISRFLDSNYTIDDECDNCNELFSKWENDLAAFLRPYLVIHGVAPGKSKPPIFQSRSINQEHSVFDFNNGKRHFNAVTKDDFTFDEKKHTGEFKFRIPRYTPLNIYKFLIKVGIEICPPDLLPEIKFICDALLDKGGAYMFSTIFRTITPKTRYAHPQAWLFKSHNIIIDNRLYPQYILLFAVTNLLFQVFLPVENEFIELANLDHKIELSLFVNSDGAKGTFRWYDMSTAVKVTHDEIIPFTFDSRLSTERIIDDIF